MVDGWGMLPPDDVGLPNPSSRSSSLCRSLVRLHRQLPVPRLLRVRLCCLVRRRAVHLSQKYTVRVSCGGGLSLLPTLSTMALARSSVKKRLLQFFPPTTCYDEYALPKYRREAFVCSRG